MCGIDSLEVDMIRCNQTVTMIVTFSISNLQEVYCDISTGSWPEILQKESVILRTTKTNKELSSNFVGSCINS